MNNTTGCADEATAEESPRAARKKTMGHQKSFALAARSVSRHPSPWPREPANSFLQESPCGTLRACHRFGGCGWFRLHVENFGHFVKLNVMCAVLGVGPAILVSAEGCCCCR